MYIQFCMGHRIIFVIIPLILSIGVTPALPFSFAEGMTCQAGEVEVVQVTNPNSICIDQFTANRWAQLGIAEIVGEPVQEDIEEVMEKPGMEEVTEDNLAIINSASNANTVFTLMEKITDGQNELATLDDLITSNGLNMGEGLTEYADALEQAAYLASSDNPEDWDQAAAILYGSEEILDDIYTQLYAQVDSRQNERFTDFVENAIDSISFIVENGAGLGISDAVIDELEVTLAILESGDYEEILAATSENSDLGLTASMFTDDHPGFGKASDVAKGTEDELGKAKGKGIGLGDADNLPLGLKKLPPGIKARYDIPTDSNLSTESSDGTNGDGVTTGDEDFDFNTLPGFGAALNNDDQGPSQTGLERGQGIGLGETPPGINIGWSPDDWWGLSFDDFESSFEEDFEPGAEGRANAASKKAAGLAKAAQARGDHGPPAGVPGPPGGGGQGQGQGGGGQGQGQGGGGQGQGQCGGGQGQGQGGSGQGQGQGGGQ